MSVWTHAAGIMRIDEISVLSGKTAEDVKKIFGKEIGFGDHFPDDDSVETLPMGSEGTLHIEVWENPENSTAAFTVSVFGDLRDFDDPRSITEWFREKTEQCRREFLDVRNACITAYSECGSIRSSSSWSYPETADTDSDIVKLHTNGLEESLRCAMCENPTRSDTGCDGGCSYDEKMLRSVLDVISRLKVKGEKKYV